MTSGYDPEQAQKEYRNVLSNYAHATKPEKERYLQQIREMVHRDGERGEEMLRNILFLDPVLWKFIPFHDLPRLIELE